MAKKPTVTTIASGYASTTTLNNNFEALRDGFDNTLSLDGSTPNAMQADLDLNGNDIINAGSILVDGDDLLALTQASLTAAQTAQTAAELAETNAETSETNAATSATSASTSASNASTSASQAASSALSASGSATASATSALAAESAETNAETAETNAAASAAAALASETAAASSASSASTSASSAASSASSASASADAALAALDNFDDRYLGQKTSDPTLDNDGDALVAGALYFNTTDEIMKVFDGSLWVAAYASLSGAMFGANNLSDVASASDSRANLGLGAGDSPTFANLDVTGTVTADGLTVDTDTLHVDSSNNRVGIGTSLPSQHLHVDGGNAIISGTLGVGTTDLSTDLGYNSLVKISGSGPAVFLEETDTNQSYAIAALGGSLIIRDATASAARITLNSTGSVGIGTSSPSQNLDVRGAGTTTIAVRTTDTSGGNIGRVRVDYTGGGGGGASQVDLRAGDAYTYLISPTNTPMLFGTNNTERMRITNTGSVGIGTSNPGTTRLMAIASSAYSSAIQATSDSSAVNWARLDVKNQNASAPFILYQDQSGNGYLRNDTATGMLAFQTGGGNERMRIASDGDIQFLTTSSTVTDNGIRFVDGPIAVFTSRDAPAAQFRRVASTATQELVTQFFGGSDANTVVGAIRVSNASTQFATTSDYRLKEDVQPMSGASDRVLALNPVNFAWKVDGTRVDGFLAHEAQEVVPEAVAGTKDAVDADGNPEYQGIDQSKLVPLLTAALQEALTEIDALKTRITALEG